MEDIREAVLEYVIDEYIDEEGTTSGFPMRTPLRRRSTP
jgi:hypothetical protein